MKDPNNCCLKDINFEVEQSGLVAIIGAVGAGKVIETILNFKKFQQQKFCKKLKFERGSF
jgi:ABC-type polysaccharide/polyol phosphate transport system ATPase subunit